MAPVVVALVRRGTGHGGRCGVRSHATSAGLTGCSAPRDVRLARSRTSGDAGVPAVGPHLGARCRLPSRCRFRSIGLRCSVRGSVADRPPAAVPERDHGSARSRASRLDPGVQSTTCCDLSQAMAVGSTRPHVAAGQGGRYQISGDRECRCGPRGRRWLGGSCARPAQPASRCLRGTPSRGRGCHRLTGGR